MIHITIHIKRYSICINDTFCLVLDQKDLIYPQISLEFGNINNQNIQNLSENVSFEVSCKGMIRYVLYSQRIALYYDLQITVNIVFLQI